MIITGSSSGIGLAASTLALASGAKVLGIDISNSPASLTANPNYTFFAADLSHPESAKKAIAACIAAYGNRIDGLLNIAGVMDLNQSADTVTDDMWDRCIAINLTAPVKLMREVIPIMRLRGKGSIVNVGSKASMSGAVSGVAYTASTLHLSHAIHLSSHSYQNIKQANTGWSELPRTLHGGLSMRESVAILSALEVRTFPVCLYFLLRMIYFPCPKSPTNIAVYQAWQRQEFVTVWTRLNLTARLWK